MSVLWLFLNCLTDTLVCPLRNVARFKDLSATEVTDLFAVVHKISRVIEKSYEGDSLTISIQDGESAGQSVPVRLFRSKSGVYMRWCNIIYKTESDILSK